MDGISGGVAIWQAAEVAIKTGEQLIARYNAYKHANERVTDLILRIEGIWLKTTTQMSIIRDLSTIISPRLQTFQEECFRRLTSHLQTALIKLTDISGHDLAAGIDVGQLTIDSRLSKKLKYAIFENQLKQVVSDLEVWHGTFDPSWYLLARVHDDDVDTMVGSVREGHQNPAVAMVRRIRELTHNRKTPQKGQGSIFATSDLVTGSGDRLHPTDLRLSTRKDDGSKVLLDTTTYPENTDQRQAINFVRGLARLLALPEMSTLSLLQCLGVIQLGEANNKTQQFQYVFALPPHKTPPSSLRAILSAPSPSLDTKLKLAKSLGKALTSLHAADYVHKNIRPETIVVFEDEHNERSIPYLVGFESLRSSEAQSSLVSDMAWERNIYRHPARQGLRPQEYYTMQHDIYSFGVCLLEIGLWKSFVEYTPSVRPNASLPIADLLQVSNKRRAASEIKNVLVNVAGKELPSRMGRKYSEVVVSSLSCLDKDVDNVFTKAADMYDEDGVAIGVAFIESILMRLESIAF